MKTTLIRRTNINRRDALKNGIGAALLTALGTRIAVPTALSTASIAITDKAHAQQPSATPPNTTEPATGIVMHADYARTIAQMAYVWG
jgi:hypothetical protein